MVLGLGPGFVLPFALVGSYSDRLSDLVLLCLSVSTVTINVVVISVEAAVIAAVERDEHGVASLQRRPTGRLVLVGAVAALLTQTIVAAVLFARAEGLEDLWQLLALLAVVPLVGVVGSVASGVLIHSGRVLLPTLSQGFRSLFPLAAVLAVDGLAPVVIGGLALLGEICRLLVLRATAGRIVWSDGSRSIRVLPLVGSTAVLQGNPVIDRTVLAGAEAGSIGSYEIADKLYFAVYQIAYIGGVLPRLGAWADAAREGDIRPFVHDLRKLMVASFIVGIGGAALLAVLLVSELVPPEWARGALWGAILLPGIFLSIAMIACTRLLAFLRAGRLLLATAAAGMLVNAVADLVLFMILGPIGVIIATLVLRVTMVALYAIAIRHAVARHIPNCSTALGEGDQPYAAF